MRLNNKEYKEFQTLQAKLKSGDLTPAEKTRLSELAAKKAVGSDGGNDVTWWKKYPQLLSGASNIPWNTVKGFHIPVIASNGNGRRYSVLNGMRIEYFRSSGRLQTSEDPLNYQMRQLWLDMHRKYRGLGAYEWADLGIVMKAIIEAFADLSRAARMYGVVTYFNTRNRSIPYQLLRALKLDASSITGDSLADFRYQLNYIVAKAKSLCLPKGLGILSSYIELEGNIFKDSDSDRAVWYVYDSFKRCYYDPASLSTGGCVRYAGRTTQSNGMQTFNDIISDLNGQFSILLSDTDVARMCSDILACYGDNTVTVSEIPENYVVNPLKHDTRVMQLHNSTYIGEVYGTKFSSNMNTELNGLSGTLQDKFLTMYQENGVIKQVLSSGTTSPSLITGTGFYWSVNTERYQGTNGDTMLDFWKDDVSEDDIVEMTRQTCTTINKSAVISGTTYYYNEIVCGHVIIENILLYFTNETGFMETPVGEINNARGNCISANGPSFIYKVGCLAQLDWHPLFWIKSDAAGDETTNASAMFWDIDNYVVISQLTLERIHDACMLSAFRFDQVNVVAHG